MATRARAIVDAALAFESEGLTPMDAFVAAVASVRGHAPSSVALARSILAALERRGNRSEAVLPYRAPNGRFVGGGYSLTGNNLHDSAAAPIESMRGVR